MMFNFVLVDRDGKFASCWGQATMRAAELATLSLLLVGGCRIASFNELTVAR
ncbi:MAG: hypothetical protein GY826_09190 [Fuerstiella sp.]|nr:hypothetical protein [Fuerstiella sp.]